MSIEPGDKITMLRTYDTGSGLIEGETVLVGHDRGGIPVGVAEALCRGEEPFADPVSDEPDRGVPAVGSDFR